MDALPRISEAEWLVMKVLWAEAPRTANAVVDALEPTSAWSPKTIKTLLNRLVNKGALGFERDGRQYLYRPLVAQADCVRAESRTFLQRVYGGALRPMLANFIAEEELSVEDIAALRGILDRKGSA